MALPLIAAGSLIATIIVPLVVKVMIALGVGYATYTGVGAIVAAAQAQVMTLISGLPAQMLAVMGQASVDKFVTIVFSAYTARLTIAGLTSAGSMTRINFKGVAGPDA